MFLLGANPERLGGWLARVAAMLLTVIFAASLAGCGGGSGGPGSGLLSSAGNLFGSSKRMSLAPVIGAPPNVAQDFSQALVDAGKDRNLTIVPGGAKEPYMLRGYLIASAERRGAKISYIWDVTDAKGARVARVSGDETVPNRTGSDPWSGVDAAFLRSLAGKTTSELAAAMGSGGGGGGGGSSGAVATAPAPTATPAAATSTGTPATATAAVQPRGPVQALVPPVTGAPGDGSRSLTTAIKKRLYSGGVKLANAGAGANVYTVKGTVKLTTASAGKESIRIDWQVINPAGKRLGTVSQQNVIPKGSLNGPWGAIADAAANAAADGIIKLLPKS
jgi:hypothetical protein